MSSYVKQITDSIEAKIISLIPAFSKSPYVWSVGNNNTKTSNNIFRVIPDAGQSIEGAMRSLTISQKFTVYLTTNFINKNASDVELQTAIESLYVSLELVTQEAMLRRFAINRIMSVPEFELTAPEIDQDNHTVTIGASYRVLYRME